MNSSSASAVYLNLSNHLRYDRKDFTAYLVEVVPRNKQAYDKPWSPNLRTTALRDDIRRIDAMSFYGLATGDNRALEKLYRALPNVLQEILKPDNIDVIDVESFVKLFDSVYA